MWVPPRSPDAVPIKNQPRKDWCGPSECGGPISNRSPPNLTTRCIHARVTAQRQISTNHHSTPYRITIKNSTTTTMSTPENTTTVGLTGSEKPKKKSLYQRYQDAKHGRNTKFSDDELLKYTGKTKSEINDWAKTQPGVAGNRAAGTLAMGPASGLGGLEAGQGYGGWGTDAKGTLKFPPTPDPAVKNKTEKEKELDDESE